MTSFYQTLGRNEIRVLQLSPSADHDAEVSATFETERLNSNAPVDFDAVSYMWGEQTHRTSISIHGFRFEISRHLCSALRTLRHTSRFRRLWIDAICINQADTDERNHQVQLMRTIYQRANTVVIWLNQDLDASHTALQKLFALTDTSKVTDLGDDPAFWAPVRELLCDQYWGRVWIQQEISNAATLRLFCRDVEIPVLSLYHFLRLYGDIQLEDIMSPAWQDWADKKPSVTLPPRFGLPDSHLQPIRGTTIGEAALDLLETLSRTNNLKCTDDRDRVYGIMFLAEDCQPGDIMVDYSRTTPEVYTTVAECVLSKYKSTRFLLYATYDYSTKAISDRTSSWVPDWRRPPARPTMPRVLSPLNRPKLSSKPSNALPRMSNGTLFLNAIKVDAIVKTYHQLFSTDLLSQTVTGFVVACTTITQHAIALAPRELSIQASTPSLDKTPQWKSLVHTLGGLDNRDKAKHQNVDTILERGAEEILVLSRERSDNFNPDAYQLGFILNHPQPSGALQLARVFITFAWWLMAQRRAPFCTALGRLGLAPACAEVGDEVWLVPGCEIPVLLRKSACGARKVVGEVYVDGVNFWEPAGGFRSMHELNIGDKVGELSVEVVALK
ncbi:heterokaryon incompatibility protein-domain-containing protein [Podospora aff. communis PSN243]|uniref:Heterokaryon incompatibility protein-domain-containing protein n=1 Tax=Podospora aff. communis PSN243 TaxID=3040156 RepID=A0AAV9G0I6_9PEZI|nr:heterokaryon incompatibility protein-domain-containing protein [Podospora aff. communis PSN243]